MFRRYLMMVPCVGSFVYMPMFYCTYQVIRSLRQICTSASTKTALLQRQMNPDLLNFIVFCSILW